jgi:hypothetical protein
VGISRISVVEACEGDRVMHEREGDRILKRPNRGDLPIERASKLGLVINWTANWA